MTTQPPEDNLKEAAGFAAGGAAAGAGASALLGGMGLAIGGTAITNYIF
ncbi:MAG: hypothetical protein ACRC2M_26050 [Planktothrix sp.]